MQDEELDEIKFEYLRDHFLADARINDLLVLWLREDINDLDLCAELLKLKTEAEAGAHATLRDKSYEEPDWEHG